MSDLPWKNSFKNKDLDAAHEYLALRLTPERAARIVPKFRTAPLEKRRVNDLLRACERKPVNPDDPGVQAKREKVEGGGKLTPALVVSFDGVGADVAQGFHELSLASDINPFMKVPVFIVYESGGTNGKADD